MASEGPKLAAEGRPRARECPGHGLEVVGTWAERGAMVCRISGPWRTKGKEASVPRGSRLRQAVSCRLSATNRHERATLLGPARLSWAYQGLSKTGSTVGLASVVRENGPLEFFRRRPDHGVSQFS